MQHFTEQFDLAAVCWVVSGGSYSVLSLQQGDLQVRLTGVGDWHSKRSRKRGLTFCVFLWPLPTYTSSCENFSLHLDSGRCQRLGWGAPICEDKLRVTGRAALCFGGSSSATSSAERAGVGDLADETDTGPLRWDGISHSSQPPQRLPSSRP